MNIEYEVIQCPVCNRKRELIDHELITLIISRSGSEINSGQKVKAVNLRLYCMHCKANYSEPYPYDDPKTVPLFLADVKKHSAKFDNVEYLEL